VSTVMEDSHDECVDAANGGLHICLLVEGDGPTGLRHCDHEDGEEAGVGGTYGIGEEADVGGGS
jgi:hypothetical protein